MVTLGLGVKPTTLLYANNQTPHSLDQFAMPQLPRPEGALIGRGDKWQQRPFQNGTG